MTNARFVAICISWKSTENNIGLRVYIGKSLPLKRKWLVIDRGVWTLQISFVIYFYYFSLQPQKLCAWAQCDVCNCVLWIVNASVSLNVDCTVFFFFVSVTFHQKCVAKMQKHHLMLCDWCLILEAIFFVTHAPYIYVNCSKHSSGNHGRGGVFFPFCAIQLFAIWFSYWCYCCCFLPNRRVQLEKCAFISSIYGVRCVHNFGVCVCWIGSSPVSSSINKTQCQRKRRRDCNRAWNEESNK